VEFADSLAETAWREQAGREFREGRLTALQDPEFCAELDEWDALDRADDVPCEPRGARLPDGRGGTRPGG
jgi:hypothetical protein